MGKSKTKVAAPVPPATTPLYVVSAKNGEFVGFLDRGDAQWTATGRNFMGSGYPTIGMQFREDNGGPRTQYPILILHLTPEAMKFARIKKV